jgi:hypothetical protein
MIGWSKPETSSPGTRRYLSDVMLLPGGASALVASSRTLEIRDLSTGPITSTVQSRGRSAIITLATMRSRHPRACSQPSANAKPMGITSCCGTSRLVCRYARSHRTGAIFGACNFLPTAARSRSSTWKPRHIPATHSSERDQPNQWPVITPPRSSTTPPLHWPTFSPPPTDTLARADYQCTLPDRSKREFDRIARNKDHPWFQTTGVNNGLPEKWASRLSRISLPIALRVSTVPEP